MKEREFNTTKINELLKPTVTNKICLKRKKFKNKKKEKKLLYALNEFNF